MSYPIFLIVTTVTVTNTTISLLYSSIRPLPFISLMSVSEFS